MRALAALGWLVLCGVACRTERPRPTIDEDLALAARALREGRLEEANELVAAARRRDPRHVAAAQWQATLASLQWRDDEAVLGQQAAVRNARAQSQPRPQVDELEGRLGDLLFQAGRWGESAGPLSLGASARDEARRRAFATVASALPFVRRATGPLLSEQALLSGQLPEFLCGGGGKQRPFVVDTGTSMTTVPRTFAAELGVRHRCPAGSALDSAGHAVPIDVGVLERFEVGEIEIGSVPVLIVEDEALLLRDFHGGLEGSPRGVLGLDLLATCRLTLDFERASVVLEVPRGLPVEQSVQCVRVDGRCLVPVVIEDTRLWFVLDTGATHSTLSEAGLARLPGGASRAVPAFRRVHKVGGSTVSVREVNGLTLHCSEARFLDIQKMPVVPRGESPLFPMHGVLGLDLLGRCRLILDRGRARLVLVP